MRKILVCGAGGFIGSHLVKRLHEYGAWICGVDLKQPEWSPTVADEFRIIDLRDQDSIFDLFLEGWDEVYQLAADMGGAGYVFTGNNDHHIMNGSSRINLNIAKVQLHKRKLP